MNKTQIKAKIVADSINQQGDRLTSLVLTYPRIIHAEMLTHRVFSRNASSSRAVPVKKMIESVRNNTFCPIEFQKSHKGMQGNEYFTGVDRQECINLWIESAELALQQAEKMKAKGISKQIINRILEPYQYYTVLITGSKEGWDNFFSLRCPQYYYDIEDKYFKSRKEWLDYYKTNCIGDAYSDFELTEMGWFSINKGQAEIHLMDLAEKIYDSMNESKPKQLKPGEWHIPFEDKIDEMELVQISPYFTPEHGGIVSSEMEDNERWIKESKVKISTAMAARTSYTVVGDEKEVDYQKMIKLHDRLIEMRHDSPLEHCARAMSDDEYETFIKGRIIDVGCEKETYEDGYECSMQFTNNIQGWCRNFKGFLSYRSILEDN